MMGGLIGQLFGAEGDKPVASGGRNARNRNGPLGGRPNDMGTQTLNGAPAGTGLSTMGSGSNDNTTPSVLQAPQAPSVMRDPMAAPVGAPAAPVAPQAPAPAPMPAVDPMSAPVGAPVAPVAPALPSDVMPNIQTSPVGPDPLSSPAGTQFDGSIPRDIPTMLQLISLKEGTTRQKAIENGYASEYDIVLGYGQFDPLINGQPLSKVRPVTSMTLNEVLAYQDQLRPRTGMNSSAVGKYQIVGKTLRGLIQQMGLSGNELFSPELQDRMAVQLLNGRGYDRFLAGQVDENAMKTALGLEWEGLKLFGFGGSSQDSNAVAGLDPNMPVQYAMGEMPAGPASMFPATRVGADNNNLMLQNAEIQSLMTELANAQGGRSNIENILNAITQTQTAGFGRGNFGQALQGQQDQSRQMAQQRIQTLISSAQNQRQFLQQQYDKMRAEASEEEKRVLDVADVVLGQNKETKTLVLAALGRDPAYSEVLSRLTQTQLTRLMVDKAQELGLSIGAPISARDQLALAKAQTELGQTQPTRQSNLSWIEGVGYGQAGSDRLRDTQLRVQQTGARFNDLISRIDANRDQVGAEGSIQNFIAGIASAAGGIGNLLSDVQWTTPSERQSFLDRMSQIGAGNREITSLMTTLTFEVARAMNGAGVLTDQDLARAADVVGSPNDWMTNPDILIRKLATLGNNMIDTDYNQLSTAYNNSTGGDFSTVLPKPAMIAVPDVQITTPPAGPQPIDTNNPAPVTPAGERKAPIRERAAAILQEVRAANPGKPDAEIKQLVQDRLRAEGY